MGTDPRAASPGYPIDGRLDIELANELAWFESFNKHHYRPNTYLHKWWARRCGSTFRLILKALVLDERRQDYYTAGGLEGMVILDPMMGGGTTLHEAIRLRANVIGVDLDPIPFLQARASLSGTPSLTDLEAAFERLCHRLVDELGHLYRTACPSCRRETAVQFTLYGAKRSCECGPALLVDSTTLWQHPGGRTVRLCPRCHRVIQPGNGCDCPSQTAGPPIHEKRVRSCPTCRAAFRESLDVTFHTRYQPVAVYSRCTRHGPFFAAPTEIDQSCFELADAARPTLPADQFAIAPGPKSVELIRHGVTSYLDLFSSRQLLYLDRATGWVQDHPHSIRLVLALLISTSLEFNSMLCGYKGGGTRRPGAIRHTFSHHAYTLPYTALENNPLFELKTSGTLRKLFHDRVRRAHKWAQQPVERRVEERRTHPVAIHGEVDMGQEVLDPADLSSGERRFLLLQDTAVSLNLPSDSVDAIVTDPPYYDSVQYSDLAAFFHVWLRRMLPGAADWQVDLSEAAVDPQANDGRQYTAVLSAILAECHRVLKESGRLVFTFHHWNPRGWTALTLALKRAGFWLINRYSVHAENPTSVHISNLRALTHDAILVLSPTPGGIASPWALPDVVDKSDSLQFCQDCGSVLGWMLDARVNEEEIARCWFDLLA